MRTAKMRSVMGGGGGWVHETSTKNKNNRIQRKEMYNKFNWFVYFLLKTCNYP